MPRPSAPHRARPVILVGVGVLTFVLVALAAPVAAQPVESRQRPFNGLFGGGPPPDPNRTRTELTLSGAIYGGYDDNLVNAAPGLGGPGAGGGANAGNLIQGTGGLRYQRGRPIRNFVFDANAYAVDYGSSGIGITKGGSVGISGQSRVGRADQFRFDQRFSYDPLFSFGPTAQIGEPVVDVDTLPQTEPAVGIFERASWASQTSLGLSRALGRRTSLNMGYDFEARMYEATDDPTSTLGDSTSHRASFQLDRALGRTWSFLTQYHFFYQRPTDSDGVRPVTDHNLNVGFGWTRRVSRTRTLHASASAGAHRVSSTLGIGVERTPFDYTAPSGQAQLGLDLGRNWNVSADYRRVVTVVPELTSQTFMTDAALVSARGLIGPRVEIMMSAGRDWSDANDIGSSAAFDSTTAGIQAQVAITRLIAATITYTRFEYEFVEVPDLPVGFAPATSRNAVRFGVTVWLPLIGRYEGEQSRGQAPAGRQ